MKIWAIVPVKPFSRAKSRLEKALAPEERESFAMKTFLHTVEVLTSVRPVSAVLVASRDPKALAIARDHGAHTVQESAETDLNSSLRRASQIVASQGADGLLIVPADIPFLNGEDIEQLLQLGRYNLSVVIAPDRVENGTNALLVNPPGLIPFSFGLGSFQRHISLAEQAGASVHIYRSEHLALDIDTPEDLDIYHRLLAEPKAPRLPVVE